MRHNGDFFFDQRRLTSILCIVFCLLYSEFCGDNLTRYRFTRAINKLNTNILHLCFSQVTFFEFIITKSVLIWEDSDDSNISRACRPLECWQRAASSSPHFEEHHVFNVARKQEPRQVKTFFRLHVYFVVLKNIFAILTFCIWHAQGLWVWKSYFNQIYCMLSPIHQ